MFYLITIGLLFLSILFGFFIAYFSDKKIKLEAMNPSLSNINTTRSQADETKEK